MVLRLENKIGFKALVPRACVTKWPTSVLAISIEHLTSASHSVARWLPRLGDVLLFL